MTTCAVITGASGTIGGALVRRWAGRGRRLVLVGRDGDRLDEAVATTVDAGGNASAVVADLSDLSSAEAVRHAVAEDDVDALVCAAGGGGRPLPVADLTASDWSDALAGNLTTTTTALAALLPGMLARGRGTIVLVGSDAGHTGVDASLPYATAKAAVAALGRHLAARAAPQGLRVNVVAPGTVRTPRIDRLGDAVLRSLADAHPVGRIGDPDEIAALIDFLTSDDASWITGETIAPGGRSLR
ncbi:SDR family oxidoreductase [uncultured Williamsia sp.]|uniref:SDR family NAD(P)-dependent oxidoreductase n=1 Tax=uncultured Williamsia sp. TaxID=259311 RepID=UPI00263652E5|nr:SDR family oxidoreductase [uncultured Williamsia sp.]